MRIGLNLLYLLPGMVGGTETYAAGLLQGLANICQEDEFIVFVNRESAAWPIPEATKFTRIVCPIRAVNRSNRYIFEQLWFPFLLSKHKIDLVHSLGYVGPLFTPCRSVLSIPDINYIRLKQNMSLKRRIFLKLCSIHAARLADHVITISEFSKNEIIGATKLSTNKITVTHLGPLRNNSTNLLGQLVEIKQQYCIQKPYIVAFAGKALHKNISSLIQAFALIKDEFPHYLVLIGHIPSNVDLSSESVREDVRKRIITTGYVSEEHILSILSYAELFVLPSLYEGFGLPVLEAQQAGVAVACSNAGSLPEVGGEGAVFFDPTSIENIIQTIRHCLLSTNLRTQIILKGRENLKRFSWTKTAMETLAVYQNVYRTTT